MTRNDPIALALQAMSEELRRDVVNHLFWSKFQGSIMPAEKSKSNNIMDARPSGKPIDVNTGISSHGIGDRMLIPMQQHLSGPPTYGDATLIGNEESPSRKWGHVAYNMVRHAITLREGEMDELREDALKAADYMRPDLALWHSQMENYYVTDALMCGVSENLYTTATDETYGQGLGIAKRYHPNLYTFTGATAAAGVLTRVGTTGKFPTDIQIFNALSNFNPASGADLTTDLGFSRYTVDAARNLCMRSKLKPLFTLNGKKFWGWLISSEQYYALLNDEVVRAVWNSQQYKSLADHPMVQGSIGAYGQFVFFEDNVSVRTYAAPAGTAWNTSTGYGLNVLGTRSLVWDKTNKVNPRFEPMTGGIAEGGGKTSVCSIIFGASMLGKADKYSAQFTKPEEVDYGNWKGVAAKAIYGYSRQDFVPQAEIGYMESAPASVTNVYNDSSILVCTWEAVVST